MRRAVAELGGPWVLVIVAASTVLDAVASIVQHVRFGSGLDLALADQAVWHYSRFETPFSSILGKNILGDHFSPLVAILSPLYWLWSDARMLLIAQSILISASIVPVFLFVRSRVARGPALLIAVAYAAFWGLQVGALYDFHELAFAPLLVALAVLLADRAVQEPRSGRWGALCGVVVLVLLVKEDLSMFVVFLGIYLLSRRSARAGGALVVLGAGWYGLTTQVLIPHFAGGHPYAHWTYTQLGSNLPSAVWGLVKAPWRLFTVGFSPVQKVHTLLALFAPFLFLSFGSRLFILAIPLLAERFLSADPNFWGAHYQYSLSLTPVLAMAAAEGLRNLLLLLRRREPAWALVLAGAMLVASVMVTELGSSDAALTAVSTGSLYTTPENAAGAASAIRQLPASGAVLAPDTVLPHVSQRDDAELITAGALDHAAYLVTNVLEPVCCATGAGTYAGVGQVLNTALANATPVYYGDGWIVARRAVRGHATNGVLTPLSAQSSASVRRDTAAVIKRYVNPFFCMRLWAQHDPSAGSCFRDSRRGFDRSEHRFSVGLSRASPELRGGCADLAASAFRAARSMKRDVTRLAAAAQLPDRTATLNVVRSVFADANDLDLAGRVQRFVVLCSARRAA